MNHTYFCVPSTFHGTWIKLSTYEIKLESHIIRFKKCLLCSCISSYVQSSGEKIILKNPRSLKEKARSPFFLLKASNQQLVSIIGSKYNVKWLLKFFYYYQRIKDLKENYLSDVLDKKIDFKVKCVFLFFVFYHRA